MWACRRRLLLQLLVAGCFVIMLRGNALAADSCASNNEQQSMNMRALQTELMVAALSCDLQDRYNDFVLRFTAPITAYTHNLTSYFRRNYDNNYESALNRFITQLANKASHISLRQDINVYCDDVEKLFNFVYRSDIGTISAYAKQRYDGWYQINKCSTDNLARYDE